MHLSYLAAKKVKDLPWVDPHASRSSGRPGVTITVDSTILANLLLRVEDMERVAQNVYNNNMGDLILLRTAIEDLLSSQKGGEPSSAKETEEPTLQENRSEGEDKTKGEEKTEGEAEFGASEGSKNMDSTT